MTDLDRLTALAQELQGKEQDLQSAFDDERFARAEVLAGVWRIVSPAIVALANHTLESDEGEVWHLVRTPVYPERGSVRCLFLAARGAHEASQDPAFVIARVEDESLVEPEIVDAYGVCEVGHRWRLADLADALEDLLLRAVNGKMVRRTAEAQERAELLRAVATLLRKVKA